MWGALLAGAGLGLIKSREQAAQARKQAILDANTALYSPWTGLKPSGQVHSAPSAFSGIAEGALGGFTMGQNIENQEAGQQLRDAELKKLNSEDELLQAQRKRLDDQNNLYGSLRARGADRLGYYPTA